MSYFADVASTSSLWTLARKTPAKPPNEVNPDVSEGLSNVILNMMAKRPEKRYATLQEVLAELAKVEQGKTPKKRRVQTDTRCFTTH